MQLIHRQYIIPRGYICNCPNQTAGRIAIPICRDAAPNWTKAVALLHRN